MNIKNSHFDNKNACFYTLLLIGNKCKAHQQLHQYHYVLVKNIFTIRYLKVSNGVVGEMQLNHTCISSVIKSQSSFFCFYKELSRTSICRSILFVSRKSR